MQNVTKQETLQLLFEHYKFDVEGIPTQRVKSVWEAENKLGFLRGIVEFGMDFHVIQLHHILTNKEFEKKEDSFIELLFDYYIRPFHRSYSQFACYSSCGSLNEDNFIHEEEQGLFHRYFKKALVKRDGGVCLFCWDRTGLQGAHIVQEDDLSILERVGLSQRHQIQNGLLLCISCHFRFSKLKRYVDIVDEKFVLEIVNYSNDETSEEYKDWQIISKILKRIRIFMEQYFTDGSKAVEPNGEMALHFVQNKPEELPNRNALEFHKTACLIWRMAGGKEPDEEYCSDDDDSGPVDTAALKKRFQVQIERKV